MISFEYLNKNKFSLFEADLFFILHTNMSVIAPTGNTYQDDFVCWTDAFGNAFRGNENRKIVIIKNDKKSVIGFFCYTANKHTFKMEEIQILPEYQSTHSIFRKLYDFVLKDLTTSIKFVEAYANKKNEKSILILKHLGLQIVGTNESGTCYFFRGTFNNLTSWFKSKCDLIKAKEMLASDNYTCVLCKGDSCFTSVLRGVKPLVKWYAENTDFSFFSAADKVVGKATAFLYVLLGVKNVYARVLSKSALEVFKNNDIEAEYGVLVDNIVNRTGDGICPFEDAVLSINDKYEAYKAIRAKMDEMNIIL